MFSKRKIMGEHKIINSVHEQANISIGYLDKGYSISNNNKVKPSRNG